MLSWWNDVGMGLASSSHTSCFRSNAAKKINETEKNNVRFVKKLWLQLQVGIKKFCDMIVNIFWMKIFTVFVLLVKLITLQIDKRFSVTSNFPLDYSGVITSKRVTNLQGSFLAAKRPGWIYLLLKKCRSGGQPLATLCPIWPAWDLNIRPPARYESVTAWPTGQYFLSKRLKKLQYLLVTFNKHPHSTVEQLTNQPIT